MATACPRSHPGSWACGEGSRQIFTTVMLLMAVSAVQNWGHFPCQGNLVPSSWPLSFPSIFLIIWKLNPNYSLKLWYVSYEEKCFCTNS